MDNSISGSVLTYAAGERLTTRGNDVDEIYIILKGRIRCMTTYGTYYLGPGSAAGLTDCYYGMYVFNYFADEDTMVKRYTVSSSTDITRVLNDQADNISIFAIMHSRHIADMIKTYLELTMKCRDVDAEYRPDSRISRWELDKFNALSSISNKTAVEFYKASLPVTIGSIYDGVRFLSTINDACSQMADRLEINVDYVEPEPEDDFIMAIEDTPAALTDTGEDFDEEFAWSQLEKSLPRILAYSEIEAEDAERFTQLMESYRIPKQQTSPSDEARQLRREISKLYYKIYYLVFCKAVNSLTTPPIISMFLNFGYMDENLLSRENSLDLYRLSLIVEKDCNGKGVYTIYSWLREILWGDKEPSKNSMDMDYTETINTSKRMGKLSAKDAEAALADNDAKVRFEIENMFTSANRVVHGRSSNFCPVLTENGITRSFSASIVTAEKIISSIDAIRKKDFSAFYREIIYQNKESEIDREFIMSEVLPNVILMPVAGNDGLMWQEIEGRLKDTPARFILPIFPTINVSNILTCVTGRFRWEMCKRSQGVYWNNISEPSLTAEYCDYIQFYKKNRDLPEAAKAKIKSTLTSCRNNYREVFVHDYETWMIYESLGSFRLNKIARHILFTYCPFSKEFRDRLSDNPMVKELFSGGNKTFMTKLKHIDLVISQLERKNLPVPKELVDYKNFLQM